ncbi:MAG: hypothetical protein QOH05_4670, partial [Acetobacteraceae bacterium]|nr:hypothetical protein [Acetobacteraceae bacterium]
PPPLQRAADVLAELLMAAVGLFMMNWGYVLCATTWNQSIAEFPSLSVGVTYLPIPLGGLCLLLFVIERLLIGPPVDKLGDAHGAVAFDYSETGAWKFSLSSALCSPASPSVYRSPMRWACRLWRRRGGSIFPRKQSCSRSPAAYRNSPC